MPSGIQGPGIDHLNSDWWEGLVCPIGQLILCLNASKAIWGSGTRLCLIWNQVVKDIYQSHISLDRRSGEDSISWEWWRYSREGHSAWVPCIGSTINLFMSCNPRGCAVGSVLEFIWFVPAVPVEPCTYFPCGAFVKSCGGCATHLWTLSLVVLITHLQSLVVHTL